MHGLLGAGRVPHGLSVLLCVGVVCGGAVLVCIMVYNEVTALTADTKFMGTMETKVDEFYESLNSSGIKILRNIAPEGHTEVQPVPWSPFVDLRE